MTLHWHATWNNKKPIAQRSWHLDNMRRYVWALWRSCVYRGSAASWNGQPSRRDKTCCASSVTKQTVCLRPHFGHSLQGSSWRPAA